MSWECRKCSQSNSDNVFICPECGFNPAKDKIEGHYVIKKTPVPIWNTIQDIVQTIMAFVWIIDVLIAIAIFICINNDDYMLIPMLFVGAVILTIVLYVATVILKLMAGIGEDIHAIRKAGE